MLMQISQEEKIFYYKNPLPPKHFSSDHSLLQGSLTTLHRSHKQHYVYKIYKINKAAPAAPTPATQERPLATAAPVKRYGEYVLVALTPPSETVAAAETEPVAVEPSETPAPLVKVVPPPMVWVSVLRPMVLSPVPVPVVVAVVAGMVMVMEAAAQNAAA
jgi:hypothetical protein